MDKVITTRILKRIAILGIFMGAGLGCGKSSKSKAAKEIPPRSGGEVESTSIQYYDGDPDISASGERIVYISGRESSGTNLSIKAFRAEWPQGGQPQNVRRVTSTDLGQEREVVLSPDGNLAVIGATQAGQKNLYLQSLTEAKNPQALTSDKLIETIGEFSPDSRLFMWTVREGLKARVKVIEIKQTQSTSSDGSTVSTYAADPATLVSLGAEVEGQVLVTWAPTATATSYKVILAKSTSGNIYNLEVATFAGVASVAAAEVKPLKLPAPYTNGIPLKKGSKLRATLKSLVFTVETGSSTFATIERVGDAPVGEKETKEKIGVLSKPVIFDESTLVEIPLPAATSEPLGFDALGAGFSSDGTFGVILSRSLFKCAEDLGAQYGLGIVLANLKDASVPVKTSRWTMRLEEIIGYPKAATPPLEPQKKASPEQWSFGLVEGFCKKTIFPETLQRLDQNISQIVINGKATSDKFRMVYASRFVPRVDRKCELKVGDLEVRAMEWSSKATVYEIAPNRADIKHAEALDIPCLVYW
jgi:hypothetical protein